MKFLEDFTPGESFDLGTHEFTAEEIVWFARQFDPQPFHLEEEAAQQSHFGALCASGWHTASVWMRLMVHRAAKEIRNIPAGEPIPFFGPSPGFDDLKWLKPVYAGDRLNYWSHVIEIRPSTSRPGWGIMRARNEAINGHGEQVMEFFSNVFVQRRSQS